jgi:hypothetical protein
MSSIAISAFEAPAPPPFRCSAARRWQAPFGRVKSKPPFCGLNLFASESSNEPTGERRRANLCGPAGGDQPNREFAVMLQNLSQDMRECYRRAEDCAEKAEDAATPALRTDFLRLERAWLTLARSYEFTGRLSDFTADRTARRDTPAAAE